MTAGVTVLARTGVREDGKPELRCILVEAGTPGFSARPMHGKMMWRSSNTAELYFEDCRVPRGQSAGHARPRVPPDAGDAGLRTTFDRGDGPRRRPGCFDRRSSTPISASSSAAHRQFQANAFKLADMAIEIETRATCSYKACWLRDNSMPFRKEAAMAKLCFGGHVRRAHPAVQLHGGYGLMKEYRWSAFIATRSSWRSARAPPRSSGS